MESTAGVSRNGTNQKKNGKSKAPKPAIVPQKTTLFAKRYSNFKKTESAKVLTRKERRRIIFKKAQRDKSIQQKQYKSRPSIPNPSSLTTDQFLNRGSFSVLESDLIVIVPERYPVVKLNVNQKNNLKAGFKSYCSTLRVKPSLIGGFYLVCGVCIVVCKNSDTSRWFTEYIDSTGELGNSGIRVSCTGPNFLSKFWLMKLILPDALVQPDLLMKKLSIQNPAFRVREWDMLSSGGLGLKRCSYLFRIPEISFKAIALMDFTVCYNLTAIKPLFIIDKKLGAN